MSRTHFAFVAAAMLAVSACAEPPTETIGTAVGAQEAAVAADASQYAPEALATVTEARAALDAELAAQEERMAIRRSYKQAETLAVALQQAGERAVQEAAAGKERARTETATMIAEARIAFDAATSALAVAPAGKGTRADLAALRMDLEAAGLNLSEAETALSAEDFTSAKAKTLAAMEAIQRVNEAVSQAQIRRAG